LTGAGIAGTVLALCRTGDADDIAEALRDRLRADDYPLLANRDHPLAPDEIAQGVVVNHAVASAGELRLA